jgi:micrococcal nuclease
MPALGEAPVGDTERATVVRVVDGDTIIIDRGRGDERLRYIGVDTPESVKPDTPVEFMAREASNANERLVAGKEVLLERDLTEYDRFDRLLRYVWVEDASRPSGWLLVNLALVEGGYAQVVTYPPDVRYVDLYLAAQQSAREQGLGLWAAETTVPATPLPLTGGTGRDGCDPAYPDVCIPPPPPDLDCRDIAFRRFTVLAPDPHRFDLDFDGVGCEGG